MLGIGCAGPSGNADFDDTSYGAAARFEVDGAFWAAPFPSDHRVDPQSRKVDVADFPNPGGIDVVDKLVGLLDDQVQGWSVSGAMYIPFEDALGDDALPTVDGSVRDDAMVFLIDVDDDSPNLGVRHPIRVAVRSLGPPFGAAHAVVALPVQGRPLDPRRRYALVVRSAVKDARGLPLRPSEVVATLTDGLVPTGWPEDVAAQYADALEVMVDEGIDVNGIAGLSVFTTSRPTRSWQAMVDQAREDGLRWGRAPLLLETFDDYCVYETFLEAPVYQGGEPPYSTEGGGFVFDEDGRLVLQRRERSRVFLTVPRVATPEPARPTVVFIRTGGGGDRPLIDRGVRAVPGEDVVGSGYAGTFARAGWAAVTLDGPLGGPFRNPTGADEQFLIFNVANPEALRDTLRQSALELALVPDALRNVIISGGTCEGLSTNPTDQIRFDTDTMALFGHSMGATIAPLTAAAEPRYRGLLLSGAGGSWIENIVHKQSPLEVRPIAATLLGESVEVVDAFHPALTLLQWAGEPADPPMYGAQLITEAPGDDARHVLMMQGLVDSYILPPIANAMSLSAGLDLAGEALDTTLAPAYDGLGSQLRWSGGTTLPFPAGLNRGTAEPRNVTALVVQHEEDGVEDGHEVAFQLPLPHHQVSCFLQGLVNDVPVVPGAGTEGDACPDPPGETED